MQAVYRPRKDTLFKIKIDKIDILIKTKKDKNPEKHTLAGCMFLLSPYKGVPPPPQDSTHQDGSWKTHPAQQQQDNFIITTVS